MGWSQLSSAFYIPADALIFHEGKKRNLGLMGPAWGQQWGRGATMGWVTEDHRGRKLASWKTFPSLVLWGPVHEIMQSVLWRKLVVTDSELTYRTPGGTLKALVKGGVGL